MIDKNVMSKAIGRIAWGYVLMHLHFNLGTIDVLPDWVGYLLIVSALGTVGVVEKSALLLKTPGYCIAGWNIVLWLVNIFQLNPNNFLYNTTDMVFSLVMLYFHFQLLTNLADIAEKYMCPHKGSLLVLRNMRTLMITFIWLPLPFEENEWLMYIPLIISLIVMVWTVAVLFSLKKGIGRYVGTEEEVIS